MPSPNDPKTSHYLGVDYGKSKIGLAIADGETRIAFSYGVLENNKEILEKLAEIIEKKEIELVVIGVPGYSGLRNREDWGNQGIYRGFGKMLEKNLSGIKIIFTDEMFTTKMAQENLKEKGMKKIKDHDHQEAARIILQEWLDSAKIKAE